MVFNTKEWGDWNFRRLGLKVTFCGLVILTLPHPSHTLHTSWSNQETLPRKIRPQVEIERWHLAWEEGCYFWWIMSGGSLQGSWGTSLSWFCHQWYMKFTQKSRMRTQGLFWGKWLCRERSGLFNYAMTFSEWEEMMKSKLRCRFIAGRTCDGQGVGWKESLPESRIHLVLVLALLWINSVVVGKSVHRLQLLFPLLSEEFEPGDSQGVSCVEAAAWLGFISQLCQLLTSCSRVIPPVWQGRPTL